MTSPGSSCGENNFGEEFTLEPVSGAAAAENEDLSGRTNEKLFNDLMEESVRGTDLV